MDSRKALAVLGELSSAQWGLVTSAQAARRGVSRLELSRLADAGLLERVSHGVYRDAGAPRDEFDGLRAAWLAIDPKVDAGARLVDVEKAAVVSGVSAADLHGIGDLRADRFEFTTPVRRQSQRPGVHFTVRALDRSHITVRHGLPVTTVERTLADLVASRTDLTHVAAALGDALRHGGIDLEELAQLLAPLAARNGLGMGDGGGFVDRLLRLAGMDADATVERIAAIDVLAAPIAFRYLAHLAVQSSGVGRDLAALVSASIASESTRAVTESFQEAMRSAVQSSGVGRDLAALVSASIASESTRALAESLQKAMGPHLASSQAIQAALAPPLEQRRKIVEKLAPSMTAMTSAAAFDSSIQGASSVGRVLAGKAGDVQ